MPEISCVGCGRNMEHSANCHIDGIGLLCLPCRKAHADEQDRLPTAEYVRGVLGTPQQEKTESIEELQSSPKRVISSIPAMTDDEVADAVKAIANNPHIPKPPHSILQQAQKGDLSLLPGGPLNSVALAIASGLDKYPRDDWKREDLNLQEYASKAIRHTYEWLEGRDADPESGVDPLAHAVADLLFVIWHNQNWSGKAKRPGAEVSE